MDVDLVYNQKYPYPKNDQELSELYDEMAIEEKQITYFAKERGMSPDCQATVFAYREQQLKIKQRKARAKVDPMECLERIRDIERESKICHINDIPRLKFQLSLQVTLLKTFGI